MSKYDRNVVGFIEAGSNKELYVEVMDGIAVLIKKALPNYFGSLTKDEILSQCLRIDNFEDILILKFEKRLDRDKDGYILGIKIWYPEEFQNDSLDQFFTLNVVCKPYMNGPIDFEEVEALVYLDFTCYLECMVVDPNELSNLPSDINLYLNINSWPDCRSSLSSFSCRGTLTAYNIFLDLLEEIEVSPVEAVYMVVDQEEYERNRKVFKIFRELLNINLDLKEIEEIALTFQIDK